MFRKEKIYIAGPECFYQNGQMVLNAMRRHAESLGFGVTLPNDHPLDMENSNLQKRADSIFADLKKVMKETTIIIADLESYRGSEADSGTIYELGMAYADGLKCYGYTRDKRPLVWKDQKYVMKDGKVYDERGRLAPYPDLPFSPAVVGSTKIVQGDFDNCLAVLITDLEEEWKAKGRDLCIADAFQNKIKTIPAEKINAENNARKPRIYLADLVRYEKNSEELYQACKKLCASFGLEAISPFDGMFDFLKTESGNPYSRAAALTENYRRLVASCDVVLADLNNYRGFECANDVGFECGMGFSMGKKLFGYMEDARPCIEKIPHQGEEAGYRDITGSNVENFNYPINLMFGSSMKIYQGTFKDAIWHVAEELQKKGGF